MLGFRALCAASALAALGAAGCANLATVPSGCGNGVVESGEDCDQTDATTSGDACGQAGTNSACRFICNGEANIACPAGWACGVDGACKLPIPGSWTPAGALVPQDEANDLLVGDFDSDGVDDVVAVSAPTVDVHFFETSRTSTESVSIIASAPAAAVGTLTTETSYAAYGPSLTLDLARGLGVFTGQTDRSLSPAVYASVSLPSEMPKPGAQPAPYRVAAYFNGLLDLPFAPTGFFAYDDQSVNTFTPPGALTPLHSFTGRTRVGTGVTGRFTTTQQCDWLALPLNDSGGHVVVYSPCDASVMIDVGFSVTTTKIAACGVPCPTPTPMDLRPLYALDVDGDGLTDLVVVAADYTFHVGYSYGNGHFGATPPGPLPGLPVPDNTFSLPFGAVVPGHGLPLALGHLTDSKAIDVVDPTGIYAGSVTAPFVFSTKPVAAPDGDLPWSEAVVADLDGDGALDLAVGSDAFAGITVYRGTHSIFFNPVDVVTSAPIKNLAVGDFDGDFVNDLVFAAIGATDTGATTPSPDTVYISFGARSGPPADPIAIGDVTGVSEIVASYESAIYASLVQDAFVVAFAPPTPATPTMPATMASNNVYLFPGDASRQIETPYYLIPSVAAEGIDGPRRSVVGSFTGRAGLGDIAVFATPAPGTCTADPCGGNLWLLQTQGDAAIEAASTMDANTPLASATLPKPFDGVDDVLIGELDPAPGGQLNQVVLATATATATGMDTALLTATVVSDAMFQGSHQFMAGSTMKVSSFDITGNTGALTAKLLTADVDGDGHRDLVLASPSAKGGLAVVLWSAESGLTVSATTTQIIDYDDLAKVCPAVPVSTGPMMPMKPKGPTIGVAALKAGTYGKGQAILVLLSNGAVRVEYDGKALVPSCLTQIATGTAIAVGDFDGDGIEDVVVSESGGLGVYYGAAYEPGMAPTTDGGAP